MTYEQYHTPYVAGRAYAKNPPGVNLTPTPLTESQFKTQFEKTQGQGRALKLELEREKNRETGWGVAIQREKNAQKSVQFDRQVEAVKTERHHLSGDKIDTETAQRQIEQARLRGKISDAQKQRLEIELGAKRDEVKYLGDARKIQKDKHDLALKVGRLDLEQLKSEYNQRREQLRLEGYKITGGLN